MGKESPSFGQERVRPAARRLKTKTLSSPSLFTSSSSPSTPPTTMAVSSSPTPPLSFRQHTTLARPELPSGRVVEYPCTPRTTAMTTARTPRDGDTQARPKPWAITGTGTNTINRKKRLENVNLRGSRKTNKTSTCQGTTSSCIKSDSTTNDSQKSALTSESIEAVPVMPGEGDEGKEEMREQEELTEEEIEKRKNIEKCMNWIVKLPAKFSGMHIVQERAPVTHD